MRVSACFNSGKYLNAQDLHGPFVATISGITPETMPKGDKKWALHLQNLKPLILNKTNANSIGELLGDDSAGWIGRHIELYPTTTDFGGQTVACVRIRRPSVPQQCHPAQPTAAYQQPESPPGPAARAPQNPAHGQQPIPPQPVQPEPTVYPPGSVNPFGGPLDA